MAIQTTIKGKVFPHLSQDFWDYGVGAMCWRHVGDGNDNAHLALLVLLPDGHPNSKGWEPHLLYADRTATDWAKPGDVHAWDGDVEHPTLHPSIQTLPSDTGWHGYIRKGILESVT